MRDGAHAKREREREGAGKDPELRPARSSLVWPWQAGPGSIVMGIMGVPPKRPRTRSPSRARSRVGTYPEHHRLVPDALSEISETFVDEEFRP